MPVAFERDWFRLISATKGAAAAAALVPPEGENRRTSHKAAEQKRRDSLKAGFDELRLLLPAINTEALDPESGEPIPGSSAPRLLPKSSLVPDDNPNRGVSKVALLKFSNEYIERLHEKVEKRDGYIEKLRAEVARLRRASGALSIDEDGAAEEEDEVRGDEGEDLLEMDMAEGEEDYNAPPGDGDGDEEEEGEGGGADHDRDHENDQEEEQGGEQDEEEGRAGLGEDMEGAWEGDESRMEVEMDDSEVGTSAMSTSTSTSSSRARPKRSKSINGNVNQHGYIVGGGGGSGSVKRSPALNPVGGLSNGPKRPGMMRGLSGGSTVRGRA